MRRMTAKQRELRRARMIEAMRRSGHKIAEPTKEEHTDDPTRDRGRARCRPYLRPHE
jgi:hypothetical protein